MASFRFAEDKSCSSRISFIPNIKTGRVFLLEGIMVVSLKKPTLPKTEVSFIELFVF